MQSLWDRFKLFLSLLWLMVIQQRNVCVPVVFAPLGGVGKGVLFTFRLSGWLLWGQLCSWGPGACGRWRERAVPHGTLEGSVGVYLGLDDGPVGILQQMPMCHVVFNACIYVGVNVLLQFLKLFWFHWHLGIDVAIVDTYGWACSSSFSTFSQSK